VGDPLLARPLVPVANLEDARRTLAALLPRVAADAGTVTVVTVIEKAGGAPDKASVEQLEDLAEETFEFVRERAADAGVDVETDVLYGTDVAETIVAAAHEVDATAVVFTPREGKRWWDLFAPDVSGSLVHDSDVPVVVLSPPTDAEGNDGAAGRTGTGSTGGDGTGSTGGDADGETE